MKIDVIFSTSHWIVPKIIIVVVILMGIIVVVAEGVARKKVGEPFFGKMGKFFIDNYDKVKFWGTLLLFVLYIFAMDLIGFLPASIVFIFLFNLLFSVTKNKKTILSSAAVSVIGSTLIWYLFGVVFNITLPTASLF